MKKTQLQIYWEDRYKYFLEVNKGIKYSNPQLNIYLAEFIESVENEAIENGEILDLTEPELSNEW